MNKMNKLWLLWASCFSLLLFTACEDDTAEPALLPASGLLMVNQGNFGPGNGTLDVYLPESKELQQNVFEEVNGEPINGIIESVSMDDDLMLITVNQMNGGGRVVFANANSLEVQHSEETESAIANSRYADFTDSRVFVSVWGPRTPEYAYPTGSVAVFDRNTYELEKSIPVPVGPEGVLVDGTNLWVANSFTDTITIINTNTLEIDRKFQAAFGVSKVVKGADNKIYLLSGSTISRYNPATFVLEEQIALPGYASKWQLMGNTLYFLTEEWDENWTMTTNTLYTLDLSQEAAPAQQVLQKQDARAFWVNPENKEIYLGIAGGADPGTLLRLAADGSTELDRKAAGVFPYQIVPR